ncbi:cilia- and flagella-associated protein 251 [Ochlerotatus camptorhynchus]|uniref:cilia- and flagella-associated protein 251 n=1 Tax=Ochlerotatus camptorhynchus TaxID=644619 RepID=UPI0031E472F8
MDTDKLNRELQIFRNHVKIARENVIHKLVRDIKFWKAKQETNADNKRASKKVESLEALIGHIKSQSASELAKAVIRFKPKKSTGCGGLEERALLRFHENNKLQPEVKTLIRRFGLNSKLEVLDKYLKNRGDGKKAQAGKKTTKRKDKPKKAAKEKKEKQESEDQGFCEADDGRESMGSASGLESSHGDDDSEEEETGKFVKLALIKERTVKKEQVPKKGEKKLKKKKESKPSEDDDTENKCVQVQDSFFVTSSGQTYVATAPVVDKKQREQEEKEEFSWKRSNKRKDILGKMEERPQKRPFSSSKEAGDNYDDIHPSWKAKQQQKGITQFQGQRKRFDEEESFPKRSNNTQEDPDLHPSWAAKQKQRNIQPFAGKKIKFDAAEESAGPAGEDLHPSWAAKQKQRGFKPFAGKKIVFDSGEQTEPKQQSTEDLHPSWAAKQKQKGLKPFQGKKIVFDADAERSVETPAPSDLHPSWAAKQKEKGIQEFQGKKITFGD